VLQLRHKLLEVRRWQGEQQPVSRQICWSTHSFEKALVSLRFQEEAVSARPRIAASPSVSLTVAPVVYISDWGGGGGVVWRFAPLLAPGSALLAPLSRCETTACD
jgi:hypothetical protein